MQCPQPSILLLSAIIHVYAEAAEDGRRSYKIANAVAFQLLLIGHNTDEIRGKYGAKMQHEVSSLSYFDDIFSTDDFQLMLNYLL